MSEVVVRFASLALAALFTWAAVAKALNWASWRTAVAGYGLPHSLERGARFAVPLAEAGVVALLLNGAVKAGAAAAVALLATFSLALLRAAHEQGREVPCGCFGKTKRRDYRLGLVRNAALAVLGAAVLLGDEGTAPLEGWTAPGAGEVLPAVLVVIGAVLLLWTVRGTTDSLRKGERP